jgi:hypothetical protein
MFDVGTGVILTVITSFTAAQIPFRVEVKVSVAEPALISEALGIYVLFNEVAPGVNVPEPALAHIPVEEPPAIEPFNKTVLLLPHTI